MPVWADGWQYFRPRVEGSFLRFFWSRGPQDLARAGQERRDDGARRAAGRLELRGRAGESIPTSPAEIFRWSLVRQYDTYGDANPASGNVDAEQRGGVPLQQRRQHRVPVGHLRHAAGSEHRHGAAVELRAPHAPGVRDAGGPDTVSYRSGWRMEQTLAAGAAWTSPARRSDGTGDAARMVRRYHLSYDPLSHAFAAAERAGGGALLRGESARRRRGAAACCPTSTNCPRLPAMTFEYGHVDAYDTAGGAGYADLPGFDGFDERIKTISQQPAALGGRSADRSVRREQRRPAGCAGDSSRLVRRRATACSSTGTAARPTASRP